MEKPVVVIELGNDWLKILALCTTLSGKKIAHGYFQKLSDINGSVSELLSKQIAHLKLNKKPVLTYLPRHLVTVRFLDFPTTHPLEIENMVSLQVGKQTPFSKDELISSFKTLSSKKEGYSRVMMVIVRRSPLNERIETIQNSGCSIGKVALSSEGLQHWLIRFLGDRSTATPYALVDIDSNYSDFIVVYKKELIFTRHILIGSGQFLDKLPEKPKQEHWKDRFLEALKLSLVRFQNENQDLKLEQLFLTGAELPLLGLEEEIAIDLELKVTKIDPFQATNIEKDPQEFPKDSLKEFSMCSLLGVALNQKDLLIDVTPDELKIQKNMEEKTKTLMLTGFLVLCLIALVPVIFLAETSRKNTYLNRLKKEVGKIEKGSSEVETMRLRIDLIKERLNMDQDALNIIHQIASVTPRSIFFTHFDITAKKSALLRGQADNRDDSDEFLSTLIHTGYFKNVSMPSTRTKTGKGKKNYLEFEIIAKLR